MLALYRSGRQAEALATYRRAHDVFVDQLGIEPGPALKELQRAVLVQDPRLEALERIESFDLLERAAPILPTGFVDRAQSLYDYGVALFRLGERARAATVLERAEEQARVAGDHGLEELSQLTRSQQANWTGARGDRDHLAQTQHSVEVFEHSGDERKLAKALLERGLVLGDLGSAAKGAPDIRTAIDLAKKTGDRWEEGWARNMLAFSNWSRGPIAVEQALEGCIEHLVAFDWRPPGPLGLWSALGYLHAQAGHAVEALTWARRAVDATREGGIRGELGAMRRRMAATLVLTGDEAGAEVELRAAHELLASIAPTDPWLSRARAELALLVCRRGELREAEMLLAAARHATTATSRAGRGGSSRRRSLRRRTAERSSRSSARRRPFGLSPKPTGSTFAPRHSRHWLSSAARVQRATRRWSLPHSEVTSSSQLGSAGSRVTPIQRPAADS